LVIYSDYRLWEAKYRSGRQSGGKSRKKQEKWGLEMRPRGI
jgi:hypothetical protein